VDLGLQVCQVVENFGRYVKYVVTSTVSDTNGIPGKAISANAFEVLMCSARALQSPESLPDAVPEKNKKDKLYNDLLLLFRSRNLKMKAAEADSIGVKVTRTLCDALWHIDGHHEVFSRRSTPLPATFKQFYDYNLPSSPNIGIVKGTTCRRRSYTPMLVPYTPPCKPIYGRRKGGAT